MQTVITNLRGPSGPASAQQTGLNCTSMARFNGLVLGAGPTGLYKVLCGATDDTVEIDAYATLAAVDLGEMYRRIRYVYFGLEATDDLLLTVTTDLETVREYPVVLNGTKQQRVRVQLDRNVKGRYWDFTISNTNGCSFSLDYIQLFYF